MGKYLHDWAKLDAQLVELVRSGQATDSIVAANLLGVTNPTLQGHLDSDYGIKLSDLQRFPEVYEAQKTARAIEVVAEAVEASERVRQHIEGNRQRIEYTGTAINTVDDLLAHCKVDLSVWQLDDPLTLKKWPLAAKNIVKSLAHSDGKRSGTEWQDGLIVHELIYIAVDMVLINPMPVRPHIVPVTIGAKLPRPRKAKRGVKRSLLIADPQVGFRRSVMTGRLEPFHDRRVLDIALQLAQEETFDDITFLGDDLDLAEWSTKFVVEPEFWHTTQPALVELHWWMQQFREAQPNATIDLLEGNHNRIESAIIQNLAAAYELRSVDQLELGPALSMEKLLALHQLHVGFVRGYKNGTAVKWLNPRVRLTHSDVARSGPGDTAKAIANKTTFTTAFGHVHRRELVSKKVELQDGHYIYSAFCPGCACHIDGRVPGGSQDNQWQQGIGIIEYTDEGDHNLIPVAIDEGRALYGGRQLEARSRDAAIEAIIGKAMVQIEKEVRQ